MSNKKILCEPSQVFQWSQEIARITKHPWTIMEICGGQTHAILRYGLDALLPDGIRLIHGPGCPVCVTSKCAIDKALEIAQNDRVILCTFGDILRVPGDGKSLGDGRADGLDVRTVSSPLEALTLAEKFPNREVVFFAIGFETTTPGSAALIDCAEKHGIENISLLMSHVRVLPAINHILSKSQGAIHGLIAAGHVCAITGFSSYYHLVQKFRVPIVVTGFEPLDILRGIYHVVLELEAGEFHVLNAYERVVRELGNARALSLTDKYLEVSDRQWRGIGLIPEGGYMIRAPYKHYDACHRFGLEPLEETEKESSIARQISEEITCYAGDVLTGSIKPTGCPFFGNICRPETPRGAPMVSHEGACAAYYYHRRSDIFYGSQQPII